MPSPSLRIALAQLNPVVGDVGDNCKKALKAHRLAAKKGADLIIFSELFLSGYPPEDLVLRPSFLGAVEAATAELAKATKNAPAILLGAPIREKGKIYNAALFLKGGRVAARQKKIHLPNYDVFDEKRIFEAGKDAVLMTLGKFKLGVLICEDMWEKSPAKDFQKKKADMLLAINGSPFEMGKRGVRLSHARARAKETGLPLLYLNQVGGQDELVFDGASFALEKDGTLAARFPSFEEGVFTLLWSKDQSFQKGGRASPPLGKNWEEGEEALYLAIMTALRDYVKKNNFPAVLFGLSGGIDSALVAALATDALGAEKVHPVLLPSLYSSKESLQDATDCAKRLRIKPRIFPIHESVEALKNILPSSQKSVVEENLQARVRGVLLMALSNMNGDMVLTTGNKSEMSVGYATLYGDMNGGFNPLKDLYKMQVYALARFRNGKKPKGALGEEGEVIPQAILSKAPSAELKPNQRDDDTLPPYDILDDILKKLIDEEKDIQAIVQSGHSAKSVRRIAELVRQAEYKRRQAPPGVKIGSRSFGRGRRYPITNRFRDDIKR